MAPGVVYTRSWVVDFVLDVAGYTSDKQLFSYRLIEPSCGEGAFLAHAVERLCLAARRSNKLSAPLLEKSICAYDIDPAAVDRSRSVIQNVLTSYGISLKDAISLSKKWVIQGNFLLSDVPSARWVVGNPPYIRASLISRKDRETYKRALSTVTMGSDLYVGFFEKGLRALEDDGSLCYICSDRWLQNRYGSRLRSFVARGYSLSAHIRMHGVNAFEEDVAAYPAISLITKGRGKKIRYMECKSGFSMDDVALAEDWLRNPTEPYESSVASGAVLSPLLDERSIPLGSPDKLGVLASIAGRYPSLEDAGVRLGIGVASGCDAVYITEDSSIVEYERLLPIFFMRDWRSGNGNRRKWLVDPWESDGSLVNLERYPKLRDYLVGHERQLRARRVAKDHPDEWYRTLDKPNHSLLGKEMLLFPDMAARSNPVYSDGSLYPHHNCYWMVSDEWDLRALGGLLMSDLVESYVDAFGVKMRGSTLRFQAQYLRRIHIPFASDVNEETKRELVEAFCTGDRERANRASRRAYGLEVNRA